MRAPINPDTNDFNRKLNGIYEDIDVYIDCQHGNKVFYYGNSILEAYIPSLQRGHNIIKTLQQIDPLIITHLQEGDSEVIFRFKYSNSDKVIPLLKPRTSGANISPFSSKNLPKSSYTIPEKDLNIYKHIVAKIPREDILTITHNTNNFIKSLATKKEFNGEYKSRYETKRFEG